jgi:hypothetical protein
MSPAHMRVNWAKGTTVPICQHLHSATDSEHRHASEKCGINEHFFRCITLERISAEVHEIIASRKQHTIDAFEHSQSAGYAVRHR